MCDTSLTKGQAEIIHAGGETPNLDDPYLRAFEMLPRPARHRVARLVANEQHSLKKAMEMEGIIVCVRR
jgi:hypothetical protein